MNQPTVLAAAAMLACAGLAVAAPSYTAQTRTVSVTTGDVTDAKTASDFDVFDTDVFASAGDNRASFSHATSLSDDAIIGSFAASLTGTNVGDIAPFATGSSEVRVDFSIDTPTDYTLTLFDQTNTGSSDGIADGGQFTSRVRLLTATDTKFSLISRSINEGGAIYRPAGEFVGDFDETDQSAAGTLEPGDYQFLYTIDTSAEESSLEFGLHPLVLAFTAQETDDSDSDSGDGDGAAVVPLPASAWAGLATLGVFGIARIKRRRLA